MITKLIIIYPFLIIEKRDIRACLETVLKNNFWEQVLKIVLWYFVEKLEMFLIFSK